MTACKEVASDEVPKEVPTETATNGVFDKASKAYLEKIDLDYSTLQKV